MSFCYNPTKTSAEAYLISRGVRSCALIELMDECEKFDMDEINKRYKEIKGTADNYELYTELVIYDKIKRAEAYIYKYPYQKLLIEFTTCDWRDDFHFSLLSNYVLGKLLRYADFSMDEYLGKTLLEEFKPPKHDVLVNEQFEDLYEEYSDEAEFDEDFYGDGFEDNDEVVYVFNENISNEERKE